MDAMLITGLVAAVIGWACMTLAYVRAYESLKSERALNSDLMKHLSASIKERQAMKATSLVPAGVMRLPPQENPNFRPRDENPRSYADDMTNAERNWRKIR